MNDRTNTTTTGRAEGIDATRPTQRMPVHARSQTMSNTAPARVSCPSFRADQPSAMSPTQKTAYATASSQRSPRGHGDHPEQHREHGADEGDRVGHGAEGADRKGGGDVKRLGPEGEVRHRHGADGPVRGTSGVTASGAVPGPGRHPGPALARYPGTEFAPTAPQSPRDAETGPMNPLRRLRVDPHLLRRTAYAVAGLAALGSMFGTFVYEAEPNSVWVIGWIPIIAVAPCRTGGSARPSSRSVAAFMASGRRTPCSCGRRCRRS